MQGAGQTDDVFGQRIVGRYRARNALLYGNTRQQYGQVAQSARIRQAARRQFVGNVQYLGGAAFGQRLQQLYQMALVYGASHALDRLDRKSTRLNSSH